MAGISFVIACGHTSEAIASAKWPLVLLTYESFITYVPLKVSYYYDRLLLIIYQNHY